MKLKNLSEKEVMLSWGSSNFFIEPGEVKEFGSRVSIAFLQRFKPNVVIFNEDDETDKNSITEEIEIVDNFIANKSVKQNKRKSKKEEVLNG